MQQATRLLSLVLIIISLSSTAESMYSPVGLWQTIDDESNQPKSIVKISLQGDTLQGEIVELLKPEDKGKICEKCKGARANQPIEGMNFLWGLSKDGDEWNGGKILDPAKGKEYKAKLRLSEGGDSLEVRGFIGFSLIGRTQTWRRLKAE